MKCQAAWKGGVNGGRMGRPQNRNENLVEWRRDNPANHSPNITEENYKLGSGAQGLTSQSEQIMKAFLTDQGGGFIEGKGEDRKGDRSRVKREREVELMLHNHTHSLPACD